MKQFSFSGKVKEEEASVKEVLEPIFKMNWHSWIAFGIFIGVYLKCTSASIPSGDAGNILNHSISRTFSVIPTN